MNFFQLIGGKFLQAFRPYPIRNVGEGIEDADVVVMKQLSERGLTRKKRVYRAIISQSGTNPPTEVEILEDTIGDITWHYDNVGLYNAHSSYFEQYNSFYSVVSGQGSASGIIMFETAQDLLTNNWEGRLTTLDLTGNPINSVIYLASVEIIIYE